MIKLTWIMQGEKSLSVWTYYVMLYSLLCVWMQPSLIALSFSNWLASALPTLNLFHHFRTSWEPDSGKAKMMTAEPPKFIILSLVLSPDNFHWNFQIWICQIGVLGQSYQFFLREWTLFPNNSIKDPWKRKLNQHLRYQSCCVHVFVHPIVAPLHVGFSIRKERRPGHKLTDITHIQ